MSQNNFIKAFDVMVYHSFFDNSKCNCLHFIPDNDTDKIFRKFGFRINTISNGFDLFYTTTTSLTSTLDYITKTTSKDYFEFNIKSSNPFFFLFTALPINFMGQLIYNSQDLKNQNKNGNIQLNETLEPSISAPFFGQLKIYFEDILKSRNTAEDLHFTINFIARATQWQYYIINKNAVQLDNPVISEKGSIQFDGPKTVTLQTGEKALLFTSNETNIPLSQKPKNKFDLINQNEPNEAGQKSSNGKTIIKGLPIPDVSRIGILANAENNQVTSPMYIYI
ncbi:hypothetical protein GKZ90_0005510 [Flavobacterium sp. MC2016-06]|jgi:hypothetical protein|uniref:hypothetical protein n=1 Tax=Flavobacterium sp. MC2016-06 TaxID=2676308 RepID=UPI0012BA6984|nr:hypothetical protein [Flavobacterium sp. MC2016-06]MBU3857594.1 hypothetical protein [Flavobacterium sp. MC2016-06]